MAPEACDSQIEECSGRGADVWALGVTMYAMCFNALPFLGTTEFLVMEAIRTEDIKEPEIAGRVLSADLRRVLYSMLQKDITKRITLDGLKNDPWF